MKTTPLTPPAASCERASSETIPTIKENMKIIQLYKDILSVASLQADEDGMVSAVAGGSSSPFMVDGKRLVLPTREHLSNPDWASRVVFHPLSENNLRGESKVMEKFRNAINKRLNYVIGLLAQELLALTVDIDAHKRLNPDQQALLTALLGADEKSKTLEQLQALLKAMGLGNNERSIVHIFLKRGGIVRGKKFNRACIVSFPLYEELGKEDAKQVYGVTVSKKNKLLLRKLLEFILPGIEKPSHFDAGSESDIAPFLDCLMHGVLKIAGCINQVVDDYENFIEDPDMFRFNSDWVEAFENLAVLLPEIRSIPMQAGNEGSTGAPVAQAAAPGQLTNVAPAAHHPAGTIGMPAAPVQHTTWGGPQTVAPPGQPAIVKTERGIDFSATLRHNPGVAAAIGAFQTAGYPGVQMAPPPGPVGARMGNPRWDQPHTQTWNGHPVAQQQWGQPQQPQVQQWNAPPPGSRI